MAKNVLIFFPYTLKENLGGPFSYLYHLKNAFNYDDINLVFLNDLISFENTNNSFPTQSSLKRLLKPFIPAKAIYSRRINIYLDQIRQISFIDELKKIDLNAFDAIHFHETIAGWRFRDLLKDYKGKVIFTPHAPKPFFLEILEDVYDMNRSQIWNRTYKKLEALDNIAFSEADVLVTPCKEALDAYEDHWPAFKKIAPTKTFHFIPTGIAKPVISRSAKDVREKLSISDKGFIVCFNGRHLKVKGYDLLVKAAKILLKQYSDIYFLITGKADKVPPIVHERWIETGWTNEPQNFVNASDIVVVPNRETLFDLNVLMVLSLAKPLILSEAGGNKYFRKFSSKGIFYFDIQKENALTEVIGNSYKMKLQLSEMGNANEGIFQQNFTLSHFAKQYHQFYLSL